MDRGAVRNGQKIKVEKQTKTNTWSTLVSVAFLNLSIYGGIKNLNSFGVSIWYNTNQYLIWTALDWTDELPNRCVCIFNVSNLNIFYYRFFFYFVLARFIIHLWRIKLNKAKITTKNLPFLRRNKKWKTK